MTAYEFLDLDERQLDLLVGEELLHDMPGAGEASDSDKLRAASAWYARARTELAGAVCQSPHVSRYLAQDGAAEREVFDAIVSALGFVAGIPVPVSILAAKIIRFGVTRLCAGPEELGVEDAASPLG